GAGSGGWLRAPHGVVEAPIEAVTQDRVAAQRLQAGGRLLHVARAIYRERRVVLAAALRAAARREVAAAPCVAAIRLAEEDDRVQLRRAVGTVAASPDRQPAQRGRRRSSPDAHSPP